MRGRGGTFEHHIARADFNTLWDWDPGGEFPSLLEHRTTHLISGPNWDEERGGGGGGGGRMGAPGVLMTYLAGAEHNTLEVRLLGRVGGGRGGGGGQTLQLAQVQYNRLDIRPVLN